jgi:hypothetical protein
VLRVKQYLRADAGPRELDAVIEALRFNSRVEALYLQNFELGMGDAQLRKLTETLKVNRNIWALNVGENFGISLGAWREFADALRETSVSFLYVSEHHLVRSAPPLKPLMRAALRSNRDRLLLEGRVPSVQVARLIRNMWWNPTSWLERLGVGTRTPRDVIEGEKQGGGGESGTGGGDNGGSESGGAWRRRSCAKGGKKKPPPTLVRKEDKGDYEPSKRPTSRGAAALRAAEARRERWEVLRRAAREAVARKGAAQAERLRAEAERLRSEEETVATVRGLVARAVSKALEAAGAVAAVVVVEGGTSGVAPLAPLLASSSSYSSSSAAALSSSAPLESKGAAAARPLSPRTKKKEPEPMLKRKGEEAAAEEDVKRRKKGGAAEGPPPSPRLRDGKTVLFPSSRRLKPSQLLPRLGKAVPRGAAVPRRPRWCLFDERRSRGRRSAEGALRVLEALLGGEEERRRHWFEGAARPQRAPKQKETKMPKEKRERPPPTALALKRRAAKAERAALAAAAAADLAAKGGEERGGEGALSSPLLPLPLPPAEQEAPAGQLATSLLPAAPQQPPLRLRLAAALLSGAAATATTATAPEEEALQPALPPPASEQQQQQEHQQQQQQQERQHQDPPFDLAGQLFETLPESAM